MRCKRKAPSIRGGNLSALNCFVRNKGSKKSSYNNVAYKVSGTSRQSYAVIQELRQTELRQARKFFYEHPTGQYSRADLCELLDKPINHVTRIVVDLLKENYIEVGGNGVNPRSDRTVELLQLRKEAGNE